MLLGECGLGVLVEGSRPQNLLADWDGWSVPASPSPRREWGCGGPQCPPIPPQGAPCTPGRVPQLAPCKGSSLHVPKYSAKGMSMPC